MMKLGYCSPFSPIKSGISDFSEELILELQKYMSIDLFYDVKPNKKEILDNFACYPIADLKKPEIRDSYDAIVYHMGNNYAYHHKIAETFLKFSGFLELHDFSLHNYLAAETYVNNDIEGYLRGVRYSHGEWGANIAQAFLDGKQGAPWETHALELTTNKHYLERAKGVIVHSEMAKQMVKGICPYLPVINIPLHAPEIIEDPTSIKMAAKKKLGINEGTVVFGSFGYATSAKRILQILEALALFKDMKSNKFKYFVVGKEDGIDVAKRAEELGLRNQVTVTGFTSLDEFNIYMSSCDICFNLRFPTHGESSASLHRMLGLGKPVIVSSIGTFDEYPDDIVMKVRYDENEINDIYNALCILINNKKKLLHRCEKALQYAKENCDLSKNVQRYVEFFQGVSHDIYQETFMDSFLDTLFELDLVSDLYIDHLLEDKKIQSVF